jgi:hypothetical protein
MTSEANQRVLPEVDTFTNLRSNKDIHSALFVDASTQACVATQRADRLIEHCLSHEKFRPSLSVALLNNSKQLIALAKPLHD